MTGFRSPAAGARRLLPRPPFAAATRATAATPAGNEVIPQLTVLVVGEDGNPQPAGRESNWAPVLQRQLESLVNRVALPRAFDDEPVVEDVGRAASYGIEGRDRRARPGCRAGPVAGSSYDDQGVGGDLKLELFRLVIGFSSILAGVIRGYLLARAVCDSCADWPR